MYCSHLKTSPLAGDVYAHGSYQGRFIQEAKGGEVQTLGSHKIGRLGEITENKTSRLTLTAWPTYHWERYMI